MEPISFPVWVFVNPIKQEENDYPFYLMVRGGEDTGLPASVPAFTSEAIAKQVAKAGEIRLPFILRQMDKAEFFDALNGCRYAEDVILDMGTPNARRVRVEVLLTHFAPE